MDNSLRNGSSSILDLSRIVVPTTNPAGLHVSKLGESSTDGFTCHGLPDHVDPVIGNHGLIGDDLVQLEDQRAQEVPRIPTTILQSEDMELTGVSEGLRCHCGKECTRYVLVFCL